MAGLAGGILGAPSGLNTVGEVFQWAEDHCEGLNAPFNLVRDVRVVYDRLPIVSDALKPSNGAQCVRYLLETDDPVLMGVDVMRAGQDALYFFALADHDLLSLWAGRVNGRNRTQMLVGSSHNRMVVAASATAFMNSRR